MTPEQLYELNEQMQKGCVACRYRQRKLNGKYKCLYDHKGFPSLGKGECKDWEKKKRV